jgi:teichuronic acid biosynthesis glycosyltransferase TuaC
MRILYLCKRHYMGHDVIDDKYARLYEQPFQLANLGNDVLGLCLSYRPCDEKTEYHQTKSGSIKWIGLNPGKLSTGILYYPQQALYEAKNFTPDVIVAASDALHIILGNWLSKKLKIPFAADLYDNFETFGLSKLPLVKLLYRRALKKACIVSCVSQNLQALIKNSINQSGTILYLPSTINRELFKPIDKQSARRALSLPENATLIGTAGGLTKEKGIDVLYKAFQKMYEDNSNIHLVLAGPVDNKCPPPKNPNVHYLGKLDHNLISTLFSSLDVGVIYVRETLYGEYSFPQKAFELEACNTPLVAAAVGALKRLYEDNQSILYKADDPISLINAINYQLVYQYLAKSEIMDWQEQAQVLHHHFLQLQRA